MMWSNHPWPPFRFVLSLAISLFLLFVYLFSWQLEEVRKVPVRFDDRIDVELPQRRRLKEARPATWRNLEIWSLTSAGTYLWRDILEGSSDTASGGTLTMGREDFDGWSIRYVSGRDVQPSYISSESEYLLLALNGRSDFTMATTRRWLREVQSLPNLKGLGLLLIGSEDCKNDWIKEELALNGGIINFVLLVYDSDLVDGRRVYQWPLGVAAYRNFPLVKMTPDKIADPRPYMCNFLGTVYEGSSRQKLMKVLEKEGLLSGRCFVKARDTWESHEPAASMVLYQRALRTSDLTLCPVGKNAESYRVYEACAMGSVPVVEDVSTGVHCSQPLLPGDVFPQQTPSSRHKMVISPYRLLKSFGAPFIFVRDWSELPTIIAKERKMSLAQIRQRRERLVKWYAEFKTKLKEGFFTVLNKTFDPLSTNSPGFGGHTEEGF